MSGQELTIVLTIPFKTDSDGNSWIDRSQLETSSELREHYTNEEWTELCEKIDFSINGDRKAS